MLLPQAAQGRYFQLGLIGKAQSPLQATGGRSPGALVFGVGLHGLDHAGDQTLTLQFGLGQPGLDVHDFIGHGAREVLVLLPQLLYVATGFQAGDIGGKDIDILAYQFVLQCFR